MPYHGRQHSGAAVIVVEKSKLILVASEIPRKVCNNAKQELCNEGNLVRTRCYQLYPNFGVAAVNNKMFASQICMNALYNTAMWSTLRYELE